MNFQRAWAIAKGHPQWIFVQGRAGIGVLGALVLTIAAMAIGEERWLRAVGVLLQLGGVVLAARAVLALMRMFELPGVRSRLLSWWSSRPGTSTTLEVHDAIHFHDSMEASLSHGLRSVAPDDSDAIKIEKLLANQAALQRTIGEIQTDIVDFRGEFRATLRGEQAARNELAARVQERLLLATVGAPSAALLGLFWIGWGLVVATFPQELSSLATWINWP